MKCLIFCGGYGTRMNNGKPGNLKPLIQISRKEILKHIMSIYEFYGIKDFVLLGGYKINDLKNFAEKIKSLNIIVLDTGESTPTGGRLLQSKHLFLDNQDFLLTYGDSLTNFNLRLALNLKETLNADMIISFYQKKLEYGILQTDENSILEMIHEKTYQVKINAGFYILNTSIFQYIKSNEDSFEIDVLPKLLNDKQIKIGVYEVDFWHPMDNPFDKESLEKILENEPDVLFKKKLL